MDWTHILTATGIALAGIVCGMLLAAAHHAGLATLTHAEPDEVPCADSAAAGV